jgi:hypothetical protein
MEERFPTPARSISSTSRERAISLCSVLAAFAIGDLTSNREFYIFRRVPGGERITFTRAPVPPEVVR